jgi:hypothetical protein
MKLLTATALGLLLIGNANAYNVLIDFEDSPLNGDTVPAGYDPIQSRGFNFSGIYEKGITNWPLGPVDDSKALHWCDACYGSGVDAITMTQDGLVAYDLVSLELAHSGYNTTIQLIGQFVGGGTISTSVYLNSTTLTNFVLGSGWTNLQSLTVRSGSNGNVAIAMDNIQVSTVPIPAAVWLFASGLGLLGWMRRRA